MDQFLQKLIKDKTIKFQGGNFITFGFLNNILTLTTATTLFQILSHKYGDSANNIIRELGKKQIKALIEAWRIASFTPEEITKILKYLGIFCYGNIELKSVNNSSNEVIFELQSAPLCRMYLKLFGFKPAKINSFIEGICEGIAETLLECSMDSREERCIVNHNEKCFIIAKKSGLEKNNTIWHKYNSNILLDTSNLIELPNTSAELIQKIDSHDMFEWDNGFFYIFKCGAFTLPSVSYTFLIKTLEEKFGNEIHSIMHHLARVQSKNAVELQVKAYGFKKDKELMLSILQHMELTGFGIGNPVKIDIGNKKAVIESKFNSYPYHYKKIFGKSKESVDHYLSGLIGGMCEGFFGVPVFTEETKCIAKGDHCCNFEVIEGKSNYKIDKPTLAIIEDKITPENFIL